MAYLYRHIRLDNNEPFYIGIGSDKDYKRAHNKKGRSFSWKDIVFKSKVPYEVEIILDNLEWEDAKNKEKEFIALYGRKDLNQGTLINFTDGGEGQWGRKDSKITKIKKSKPKSKSAIINMKKSHINRDYSYLIGKAGAKRGVSKSKIHTQKIQEYSNTRKINVFCPELDITFDSLTSTGKHFNTSPGHISNVINSKTNKMRNGFTLIKN